MAAIIFINPNGKTHYSSLKNYKEPFKEFQRLCLSDYVFYSNKEGLSMKWISKNECVIRWKEGLEWLEDRYIYDENNNDTYTNF